MAFGSLQRLRGDATSLSSDITLNAAGTLAMLVVGWLIAADRGLPHLPRSTAFAAIGVTVFVAGAAAAAAWFAWSAGGSLLQAVRDLGVNVVANMLAAGLVWLLLLAAGVAGPGPGAVIGPALLLALPLLVWFKLARDVGVNLLSTVVVLSGSWLLALAGGSVSSPLLITLAAVIGVLLPAAALTIMVTVDVRAARRSGTDRVARLARTVSVELAANLMAAAAVVLALAAFGILRLDNGLAFFAMQFVSLPVAFVFIELAEEAGIYADFLSALVYLVFAAVMVLFQLAVWQLQGRPDLRGVTVLVVIGFVVLLRAIGRRQRSHGTQDPVARRLEMAGWLMVNPTWMLVDFTLFTVGTSPDTPGWVKELVKIVMAVV